MSNATEKGIRFWTFRNVPGQDLWQMVAYVNITWIYPPTQDAILTNEALVRDPRS